MTLFRYLIYVSAGAPNFLHRSLRIANTLLFAVYLLYFVVTAEQSLLKKQNEGRNVSEIDATSHAILNALENEVEGIAYCKINKCLLILTRSTVNRKSINNELIIM